MSLISSWIGIVSHPVAFLLLAIVSETKISLCSLIGVIRLRVSTPSPFCYHMRQKHLELGCASGTRGIPTGLRVQRLFIDPSPGAPQIPDGSNNRIT